MGQRRRRPRTPQRCPGRLRVAQNDRAPARPPIGQYPLGPRKPIARRWAPCGSGRNYPNLLLPRFRRRLKDRGEGSCPARWAQRTLPGRCQTLQLPQVGQGDVPVCPTHLRARCQRGAYRRALRAPKESATQVVGELRTGHPGGFTAVARSTLAHTRDRAADRGGNAAGGAARAARGWGFCWSGLEFRGCHGVGGHPRRWHLGIRACVCPYTRNWGQLCHSPAMIRRCSGPGQGGS